MPVRRQLERQMSRLLDVTSLAVATSLAYINYTALSMDLPGCTNSIYSTGSEVSATISVLRVRRVCSSSVRAILFQNRTPLVAYQFVSLRVPTEYTMKSFIIWHAAAATLIQGAVRDLALI